MRWSLPPVFFNGTPGIWQHIIREKESYCLFKLVRMRTLCCMEEAMRQKHDAGEAAEILRSRPDTRKQLDIRLEGRKKVKVKCMEYLKGEIEEEKENGGFHNAAQGAGK